MSFLSTSLRQAVRPTAQLAVKRSQAPLFAVSRRAYSGAHEEESYPVFNQRYAQFFDGVEDLFELQRGLNNSFSYDLVPAVPTIEAALKAARRVNDLPTAIRIFEGLKEKVENKQQYQAYLDELKTLREELGVPLKEELYGLPL